MNTFFKSCAAFAIITVPHVAAAQVWLESYESDSVAVSGAAESFNTFFLADNFMFQAESVETSSRSTPIALMESSPAEASSSDCYIGGEYSLSDCAPADDDKKVKGHPLLDPSLQKSATIEITLDSLIRNPELVFVHEGFPDIPAQLEVLLKHETQQIKIYAAQLLGELATPPEPPVKGMTEDQIKSAISKLEAALKDAKDAKDADLIKAIEEAIEKLKKPKK